MIKLFTGLTALLQKQEQRFVDQKDADNAAVQTCLLGNSYYSDGTTVDISYDPIAKNIVYNVNVT